MMIEFGSQFDIGDPALGAVSSVSKDRLYELARRELDKRGVAEGHGYSIGAPDVSDCLCLHDEGPFWVVYFSERGRRTTPAFFVSSLDAINFFVMKVVGSSD